jgi:hypothetical protein
LSLNLFLTAALVGFLEGEQLLLLLPLLALLPLLLLLLLLL